MDFTKIWNTMRTLVEIIETYSSFERLKKTLRRHVVEMFSGEMNEALQVTSLVFV